MPMLHHSFTSSSYVFVAYLDHTLLQKQLSVVHSAYMSEELQFPFCHSLINIDFHPEHSLYYNIIVILCIQLIVSIIP